MLYLYAVSIPETLNDETFDYLLNYISVKRMEKIHKYRRRQDKLRSLFAELLLRYILQNNLNIPSEKIKFCFNEYEKPSLQGMEDLYFNLSHSSKWVFCAVGDSVVGTDVEIQKENNLDIAKRFYTKAEYRTIFDFPQEEQAKYFYKFWTLKESYIKAKGKGLHIPLDSFEFKLDGESIFLYLEGIMNTEYHFKSLALDEKHLAAVCWGGLKEELIKSNIEILDSSQIIMWL